MEEYKHFLENINESVIDNPKHYVSICEHRYENILRQSVREIVAKPSKNKIIMLAGPSSSGKTTGANKIARNISRMGYNAYVVSLDDFYRNREEIPFGPDGKQDFETVEALNLDLIGDCLTSITRDGHTCLPSFNFETGHRTDNVIDLKLEEGDVVVVEGLHALNPKVTNYIDGANLTKMYVSVASDIYFNNSGNEEIFLGRRDVRFLRRMIRDYYTRNSSVANTYDMWPKVVEGEIKYLIPFMDSSDYILDSIHAYEICVYKETALKLLSELPPDHENYEDARNLMKRLVLIDELDKLMVPRTSLLREFIGN